MSHNSSLPPLTRTDYHLVSFIGVSFALFAIPILANLSLPFVNITPLFVLLLVAFFTLLANVALFVAWKIGTRIPVVFQFAKFGAVGAFNTFLDWAVFSLLMIITDIHSGIAISLFKSISFIIAMIAGYFWNKYWTFNARETTGEHEMAKFAMISFAGFVINVGLTSAIVFVFADSAIVSPAQLAQTAAAIATIASLVWNFIGYKFFVFKK